MSLKYAANSVFKWRHLEKIKDIYKTHPQFSNACTGFITFTVGDIIAQKIDKNNSKNINVSRAIQLGLLGVVMNGFFLHRWFLILDKVVGKSTKNGAVLKVIADQVIYAPFAIISFFGFACVMKPSAEFRMETLIDKIQNDFVKTYIADCTIWPAANFINFSFVPLIYRASFTAVTQLVWQTYLSVVTHMNKGTLKQTTPPRSDNTLHNDPLLDLDESSLHEQGPGRIELLADAAGARISSIHVQ